MHSNWAHEFPLQAGLIHLNHAGVGPWPKRTTQAVTEFAQQNTESGSKNYPQWGKTEAELRAYCQKLINAEHEEDIAFIKNTSEGLSIVAYGIDWQPRDNIIYAQQEFPSNRIVWESLQPRFGVEARSVDLDQDKSPEDALFSQVDKHTRLISISTVQYANGLRMDLARISEYCKTKNILLCLDAIQHLGAIPFDLSSTPADFVVASGHKWLLGPEGIGLFYCNPQVREQLQLNQFGWHMMDPYGDFEARDWSPAKDARRFESGTQNNIGIHAMHASLGLILEIGVDHMYENISKSITYLYEKYKNLGLNILSDMENQRRSGIITAHFTGIDNHQLFKHLIHSNVLCAYRNGGIRFSPHFYIKTDEIDEVLNRVSSFMK